MRKRPSSSDQVSDPNANNQNSNKQVTRNSNNNSTHSNHQEDTYGQENNTEGNLLDNQHIMQTPQKQEK